MFKTLREMTMALLAGAALAALFTPHAAAAGSWISSNWNAGPVFFHSTNSGRWTRVEVGLAGSGNPQVVRSVAGTNNTWHSTSAWCVVNSAGNGFVEHTGGFSGPHIGHQYWIACPELPGPFAPPPPIAEEGVGHIWEP